MPSAPLTGDHRFVKSINRMALLRLLRDAPLRAKQGAANVERVDRWFRWERCVATTRAQYESAVEAWRARPASAP